MAGTPLDAAGKGFGVLKGPNGTARNVRKSWDRALQPERPLIAPLDAAGRGAKLTQSPAAGKATNNSWKDHCSAGNVGKSWEHDSWKDH